jgi:hypothetical protein
VCLSVRCLNSLSLSLSLPLPLSPPLSACVCCASVRLSVSLFCICHGLARWFHRSAVFGEKCTRSTGKALARFGKAIVNLPSMFKKCLCGAMFKLAIMAFISLTIVILVVLWRQGLIQ